MFRKAVGFMLLLAGCSELLEIASVQLESQLVESKPPENAVATLEGRDDQLILRRTISTSSRCQNSGADVTREDGHEIPLGGGVYPKPPAEHALDNHSVTIR
jgi:hypothetical protein